MHGDLQASQWPIEVSDVVSSFVFAAEAQMLTQQSVQPGATVSCGLMTLIALDTLTSAN